MLRNRFVCACTEKCLCVFKECVPVEQRKTWIKQTIERHFHSFHELNSNNAQNNPKTLQIVLGQIELVFVTYFLCWQIWIAYHVASIIYTHKLCVAGQKLQSDKTCFEFYEVHMLTSFANDPTKNGMHIRWKTNKSTFDDQMSGPF